MDMTTTEANMDLENITKTETEFRAENEFVWSNSLGGGYCECIGYESQEDLDNDTDNTLAISREICLEG